jgi:hypothetical protein
MHRSTIKPALTNKQNPVQDDDAGGGRTAQLVDLAMQVFMRAHKTKRKNKQTCIT